MRGVWLIYVLTLFFFSCKAQKEEQVEIPEPLKNGKEIILHRRGYVVSYNAELKIPNWVAWHLTANHTDGDIKRFNSYLEDEELPYPRATPDDYKGRGWSHGHMCLQVITSGIGKLCKKHFS